MGNLLINESRVENVAILVCAGRLDNTAPVILEASTAPLLSQGVKQIVLDFAGVDYMSSAGIRGLLLVLKKTNLAGGVMAVCAVTPSVNELLQLAGFHSILQIYPDRLSAANALAGKVPE